MWKCVDESHHKIVTDILCVSREDARKIEKETMGTSFSSSTSCLKFSLLGDKILALSPELVEQFFWLCLHGHI